MNLAKRIDDSPVARVIAFAACVAVLFLGGGHLVRMGWKAFRTGEFPNQRTGKVVSGSPARLMACLAMGIGAAGILAGSAVVALALKG